MESTVVYASSDNVDVFPSAKRGAQENAKRTARLLTEQNLINIILSLLDTHADDDDKSFVIRADSEFIEFILHGYYFKVDRTDSAVYGEPDIYANIILNSTTVGEDTISELDGVDVDGEYHGVSFTYDKPDENSSYSLKILSNNKVPEESRYKFAFETICNNFDFGTDA